MSGSSACVSVGANVARVSYKLPRTVRRVINYPKNRKPPNWESLKVLQRTAERIDATGIKFDAQIVVPVSEKVAKNGREFHKLSDRIRKRVTRACGVEVFVYIRLHSVVKPGGIVQYHLHIALACATYDLIDKAVEVVSNMFSEENVSITYVETMEHSKNLLRYLTSKKPSDFTYHQENDCNFRPWSFVNYKYIHEIAKKQRKRDNTNKNAKIKNDTSKYDTITVDVPGKVADTFKKLYAKYLKQRIGRLPYFSKLKAGFRWRTWVYMYKDTINLLKRAFQLHNIPIPPELAAA